MTFPREQRRIGRGRRRYQWLAQNQCDLGVTCFCGQGRSSAGESKQLTLPHPDPERKQGFFMPKAHPIVPQEEARLSARPTESHVSTLAILFALSFCQLLNDAIQAL